MADISNTLLTKSDQLNADDLVGGPITVQITHASVAGSEQPVALSISGGFQPWKPCKTMRRVMALAWTPETDHWVGQWVTLYREPNVKFGSDVVGGIRIAAMSGIPKRIEVNLAASKGGKKSLHKIDVLKPPVPPAQPMSAKDFAAACADANARGWTGEQIMAVNGGRAADVPPDRRRGCAEALAGPPPQRPIVDATPPDDTNDL